MLHKILFSCLFSCAFLNFSLFAENEDTFPAILQELSSRPASQLDIKLLQLNLLLNDQSIGLTRAFNCSLPDHFNEGKMKLCPFSVRLADQAKCYQDPANSQLLTCEILLSDDVKDILDKSIKTMISEILYLQALVLTKSFIHSSLDPSHFKVIIKKRITLTIKNCEAFCSDPLFSTENIWVTWENGSSSYQPAFFDQAESIPPLNVKMDTQLFTFKEIGVLAQVLGDAQLAALQQIAALNQIVGDTLKVLSGASADHKPLEEEGQDIQSFVPSP